MTSHDVTVLFPTDDEDQKKKNCNIKNGGKKFQVRVMKKKRKAKRSGAIKEESADERGHKEKKMRNKRETAAIKEMKS